MLLKLLLAFTVVPLAELYLLLALTRWWQSIEATILLVIVTGVVGAWLARRQGLHAFVDIQNSLARGELPGDRLLDAGMILIAGALLITPGVLTDLAGFLLLAPPARAPVRALIKRRFRRSMWYRSGPAGEQSVFSPISETPSDGFPPLEDESDPR
jgi:UPF0716 protein FxsA